MRKIALIACTKEKLDCNAPAIEMYIAKEFNQWVEDTLVKKVDAIYILSGKYGLLLPHEIIEPYDFNLNEATDDEKSKWGIEVLSRLKQLEALDSCHVYFYANQLYADRIKFACKSFEFPYNIQ